MTLLLGPFHVVLLVLLISGADKIFRPQAAGEALKASGLATGPTRVSVGRLLGVVEVSCAALAFRQPSPATALAVAVVFAGFIWFVRRLRTTDATAGCGCFGSSTTPPGAAHELFNLVATSVALIAAATMAVATGRPEIELVRAEGLTVLGAYLVTALVGAMLFLNGPTLLAEVAAAKSGDHTHRTAQTFSISKAFKA
jgi:hypothetical protein